MSVFKENKKLNETSLDKRFVLIGDYEDYDGSMSYGITLGEYETYEDAEEAMKEYPGYGKNIDSAYVNLEIIDLDSYEYGEGRRVDDGIEEDEYKEDDYMSEYNNGANVYEIELQLDDHGFESDRDFIKFVFDSYGVSARKIDDNTWRFYSDNLNEIKSYIAYSYYLNRPHDKETVWNMYKNIKKVNESFGKDRPITSEDWTKYLNKKLGVLKDSDGYPYYVENYSSDNNYEVVVQNKHVDKVQKILSDIANEYYKEFFYSMREEKLDGNRAVFYMEVDTFDEETLNYMISDLEKEFRNYKESMDGDKYHEYYSQDEELLYLFPNEGAFIDAIDYLYQYDLMLLGRNIFENEDNLVVSGTLEDLERFADEVLAYELHPDYLYKEDEFAGDIIDLTATDDTDMYDESTSVEESKKYKYKKISESVKMEIFSWDNVDKNIDRIKAGATIEDGNYVVYNYGYQVATEKSQEVTLDTIDDVKKYVKDNGLKSFGIWFENGKYVLDTDTAHIEDFDDAVDAAKKANQKAIFDWANMDSIYIQK